MADFSFIECTTTFGSEEAAQLCARALVEKRLAACVQISSIESIYRWQGEVQQDKEWKLTIKTTSARQPDLIAAIRHLHSYTEPEIIILPILDASEGYARWLREQTTPT